MAFNNFFLNFNINFAQPRFGFNFGCFSMPNFFSGMSLFNIGFGFNTFNYSSLFQPYSNLTMFNYPSVFNGMSNIQTNQYIAPNFNSSYIYNSCMPQFNVDTFQSTIQSSSYSRVSTKSYTGTLKDYNATLGKKLAEIALRDSTGFNNGCATSVKNAIKKAGLGKYETGDAHMTDEILAKNPNFKKISTDGVDLKKLPAGCVLVYEKGVAGYSSEYGHVEITTGDGRGVSDGITQNLRKPSSIFIPV